MGPLTSPHLLVAELTHRIHSPLAAIRNALYLAGCRTDDPLVHAYLEIADSEVNSIVRTLGEARHSADQAPANGHALGGGANGRTAARSAAAGHITGITVSGCS